MPWDNLEALLLIFGMVLVGLLGLVAVAILVLLWLLRRHRRNYH